MAAAEVNSVATGRFWDLFHGLPPEIQKRAVKNYELWRRDPHHPSLHFRRLRGSRRKAVNKKIPKLARTVADKHLLLLEREHVFLAESEILSEIKRLASGVSDLAKVDEIWLADTCALTSEGWAYFKLFDDGMLVEILRFHNGVLKHRRRDRPW